LIKENAFMLKTISENPLISTIVATIIVAGIFWLIKAVKDRNDSQAIYRFLLASKEKTEYTFRSTAAISSATRIPESRVAELCSRNKKIKRNELEKQSWKIVG
jgi:hypothetical protein